MKEEQLVIDYLESEGWYYDELKTSDVREAGTCYYVSECSSGYHYGNTIVTPAEIMVWLHERLLKVEGYEHDRSISN